MYQKNFRDLAMTDTMIAGGKGASLGEMTKAGIPVPPGFVVLSSTFDHFITLSGIGQEIDDILAKLNHKEVIDGEKASETIQNLIKNAQMPTDIAREIEQGFAELGAEYVAVRSSATAEDGAENAWAGQLDSYLNVTKTTLLEKVQHCWASLFTPRAIFYRFEKGLETTHISVAVVIQKMVNSEFSGVAFSVHPVTENRNELIIEAGFGLGEAIVSGSVTPDSYVVQKEQRKIIETSISTQTRGIYRIENGGSEWREISGSKASTQVLTQTQILELSEIILRIERHYRFPCDIEWAFEEGKFYIVQSRPITTLKTVDNQDKQSINKKALYKQEGKVGFYQVSLPYITGTSRMKKYLGNSYEHIWVHTKEGFITGFFEQDSMKNISQEIFDRAEDGSFFQIWKQWNGIDAEMLQISKEINNLILSDLSNIELWQWYQRIFEIDMKMWDISIFIDALDIGDDHTEIDRISDRYRFTPEETQILLTPKIQSYITEIENNRYLVKTGKKTISDFREEYFWYGTDYSVFNEVDENFVRQRFETAHYEDFEDVSEKEKMILQKYRLETNPLEAFQILAQWRDERKKANYVGLYGCCRLLSEGLRRKNIDPRLINNLFVGEEESVFVGNIASEILMSRFGSDVLLEVSEDGKYSFIEGSIAKEKFKELLECLPKAETRELVGNIASSGVARGRVRIIHHYASESAKYMEDGDILVTSMTRPEFVPLMRKAGAIVTNEGGISCHAAIVSRELKKPCIIGTKIATQVLKDGDFVEVDADNGVVRILEKQEIYLGHYGQYQKCFQWKGGGLPFLISDIFMGHYKTLKCLIVCSEGTWINFLPKTVIETTLSEGLAMIGDVTKFDNYRRDFDEYKKECLGFFENLVAQDGIKKGDIENMFIYLQRFFYFYSQTEFFYTDRAYEHSFHNTVISENLGRFDEIKNGGRLFLNKCFLGQESYLEEILRRISVVSSVDIDDLRYYSIREILRLVENKKDIVLKEKTLERKQAYIIQPTDDDLLFSEGIVAENMVKNFLDESLDSHITMIRGTTANKGCVRGKVKILEASFQEFDKIPEMIDSMEQGDILVADTTSPELIVACHKASAIVTNQGGLMSHAAIVARELGIPCIVGTGNATIILKDGDLVEVDADNGVVRILEKAEKKDITKEILETKWSHLGKWIEPALAAEVWLEYGKVAQQFFVEKLDNKILYLNGDFFLSEHDSEIYKSEGYEAAKNLNKDFFQKIYSTVENVSNTVSDQVKHISSVVEYLEIYKQLTGVWMSLNNIAVGVEKYVQETNPDAFALSKGYVDSKPWTLQQIEEMQNLQEKIEKNIGKKLEKSSEIPQEFLFETQEHVRKYEWIGTHHFTIGQLTIENLVDRMQQTPKKDSVDQSHITDAKTQYLLWLLDLMGYVRFKAAETSGHATYHLRDHLQQIAEEKDLGYDDIVEHTISEIASGSLSKEITEERKKNTGFYYGDREYQLTPEQINACLKELIKIEEVENDEIRGLVAHKGKVQGKVKIVTHKSQMEGFEDGMILVAHETTPDVIFAMQKSAAIVTDFGGLTSHAAIIARELKKPCIVGTGNCTKLLKDGDLVEVDADNGVVRILTK